MKARIAELVGALRAAGIAISVAEAMDAARAAAVAGVDRGVLREALAAALVKDEADRPAFLVAFARVFPARAADAPATPRGKRGRRAGAAGGGDDGPPSGAASAGGAGGARRRRADDPSPDRATPASASPSGDRGDDERAGRGDDERGGRADDEPGRRGDQERGGARDDQRDGRRDARADGRADAEAAEDADADAERASFDRARVLRTRRLAELPFRAMTPADVEACAPLVAAIAARVTARLRRRLTPKKTGRLDFRRTIRAAVPRAGVPFERHYRGRRPGRPDLVALCDVSASAAVATDFFLALLAPATAYFRRVRLFGFVDRLVEIEFVGGQVRPAAPLDLMARSDFGRVLRDLDDLPEPLGADTVLLVLGDARNNRRPPRADLLAAARARVRRLVWLNPEPRERWDTGDSVIAAYARHADVIESCGTLAELERALAAVAKI